jgi:SAM-dependent methyltransferase
LPIELVKIQTIINFVSHDFENLNQTIFLQITLVMIKKKLTTPGFWEEYWEKRNRVSEKKKKSLLTSELLKTFKRYLKIDPTLNILEIGGAPGEYLLFMASQFNYSVHSLDYSSIGNNQTVETFRIAGRKVQIYERDLFAENPDLPLFDIVYSLGFIEHFDDPAKAISKHLDLLKPGGILIMGVPNLTGIYHWFLKYLSPSHDKTHNLGTMNINNWKSFENVFQVTPIFKGYIGGFEPLVMKKMDVRTPLNLFLSIIVKGLMVIFSFRLTFLRKFNSKCWSGYLIGIYKKPI